MADTNSSGTNSSCSTGSERAALGGSGTDGTDTMVASGPPPSPWQRPCEFTLEDQEAFDSAAYEADWYELTDEGHLLDSTGPGRVGPLGDVVRTLRFALQVVREQFDTVLEAGAHRAVAAGDLAQVLGQASQVQRAAEAVAVAATAGYARREEHDDIDDPTRAVTSIRARGFVHEWAPQEVGHLLRLSTRTGATRVELAAALTSRMPRTLEAVRDGAIESWQASKALDLLLDAGADDETAREVDAFIGPRLATTDPTRILTLVRYALGRIRPDLLPERAKKARQNRCIEKWEIEPGLTEIIVRMSSEKAAALWAAATTLAKDYLKDDPSLTMDQARADAFVDLALANVEVKTTVTLGVPVATSAYARTGEAPVDLRDPEAPAPGEEPMPGEPLPGEPDAGYRGPGPVPRKVPDWAAHPDAASSSFTAPPSCRPGEQRWWVSGVHLPGIGYVPPDVVQSLITAFGTTISTALLDSERGTLLSYIHHGYRPPTAMKELVRLRDGRCRTFGCTINAMRCDQDHATPYNCAKTRGGDGPTCGENLAGLCRRHHQAKQRREWCYFLDPDTSVTWWVNSRTGAIRTTVPDIAIGCLEPPLTRVWDRHRPADHSDDRARVNALPAHGLAVPTIDELSRPSSQPPTPTGDAVITPGELTTPGDALGPSQTMAARRKKVPDPTIPPPPPPPPPPF